MQVPHRNNKALSERFFVCVCAGRRLQVCVLSPRSAQLPAAVNIFDLRHKYDFVSIVIRCCDKIS